MTPDDIIAYWREAGPDHWFNADPALDVDVRRRFEDVWRNARDGKLVDWERSPTGMLALILVLDQFPRNMFRGQPDAFATDSMALALAKRMIENGDAAKIDPDLRQFVYMPLMHSENLDDQIQCVALFDAFGNPDNKKYAEIHADIIRRFGRFPHRNVILGRQTTDQEAAFLNSGGFAG